MKVRFWGVRGSIASPGPKTVRYGGNTTCIEIRTDNNELIILDAGTGIFPLSQTLLAEMPVTANVLITHSHWDHIQGLPFFIPNFIPGNTLRLHGGFDPVSGKGIEQVMAVQLQYSYFPVREEEMKARIEYVTLMPDQPVQIGSATVTPCLLNHPVVDFGYRIDCNGKSVFFTGDHEPPYNIYVPGEEGYAEYQTFVDEKTEPSWRPYVASMYSSQTPRTPIRNTLQKRAGDTEPLAPASRWPMQRAPRCFLHSP